MYILGISAYYHDSAAVIIKDDVILAAVQEERFTRKKHDSRFPAKSIKFCLEEAGINLGDVSYIAFYDKPFLKFERLLESYLSEAPKGFRSFVKSIPVWLKEKLYLKEVLCRELNELSHEMGAELSKKEIQKKLMFGEHHQSHAASAFYPSPFENAAILTIDGVGEWATTTLAYGGGNDIEFLKEIHFPHSLGLLYSAFTYYLGFKVNSGEYKVMGLAPYGEPKYENLIKEHLIDIKEDGSFKLNMAYFDYVSGLTMVNKKFHKLFGAAPRRKESELTQNDMDIAASIQKVTEDVMIKLARYAREITGSENLCLAGGVALNCVGNGKIYREKIFENIWVQPAAGDAGGALGAANAVYYQELGQPRVIDSQKIDAMSGSFLGPKYTTEDTRAYLDTAKAKYELLAVDQLLDKVVDQLESGKVVGWHHDKMEFGPRSLGHRSILGDARNVEMQSRINLKIKYRESFRPFAPSVLREGVADWFDYEGDSPYMLMVAPVRESRRILSAEADKESSVLEKLKKARSDIPAVTHIDYSARVQTVHKETNERFYELISRFEQRTGCPVIVNTSFNVRGEPIVCTPEDSYRCFMRTEMDVLVIDNFILFKEDQENIEGQDNWQEEFELD